MRALDASEVTTSEVTTDESFHLLKEGSNFAFCENKIAGTLYSKYSQACSYTCESKNQCKARTSEEMKGILSYMGPHMNCQENTNFVFVIIIQLEYLVTRHIPKN